MNEQKVNHVTKRCNETTQTNTADSHQQHLIFAETMLDQIDEAQYQVRQLQNDISLLQTAENTLDLISENLAKIRRLTVEKKNLCYSDTHKMMELNHHIRNLIMINTLVIEGAEFDGHNLFNDDVIRMEGTGNMDVYLTTTKLPEIAGLDNNDMDATMDCLELAARTINRQYERIGQTMQTLLTYYQNLRNELSLLIMSQTHRQKPLD